MEFPRAPGPPRRPFKAAYGVEVAVVAVGAGLRILQYLGRDSFFLDEVAVLRNVVERPLGPLLAQPMAYDQSAPPGFLLVEKGVLGALGVTEQTARLFPLVASLAALVVFARLTRRLFSRPAALAALVLFAGAGPLIFWAAQAKPYSGDVLATCTLLLSATSFATARTPRACYVFGAAAVTLVWFSQPAVLVVAGVGAMLLASELVRVRRGEEGTRPPLVVVLGLSAISAGAAVSLAQHRLTPRTAEYLHLFWAGGFPPHDLAPWSASPWIYARLRDLFGTGAGTASLAYPSPGAFALAAVAGLVLLGLRTPAGPLVGAPVLVAVAAAGAGRYPFAERLLLFLLPCLFLAVAAAGEVLGWVAGRVWGRLSALPPLGVAALACVAVATTPPPYHVEHVRPVFDDVAAKRRPGDKVYVYYGMAPAFWYYGPRSGLSDPSVVVGGCHRGDTRRYLEELDALRGAPHAFVILGHAVGGYSESRDILRYLDAIGAKRSRLGEVDRLYTRAGGPSVEAIEYDLSDPRRLRAASAATFRLPRGSTLNPAYTCEAGPIAMTGQEPAPRSAPGD